MSVRAIHGDCLRAMRLMSRIGSIQFDSVVTDPPYHLQSINKRFAQAPRNEMTERYAVGAYGRHAKGFMGKEWDGGDIAMRLETWAEVLRLLKPGGHLIALCGTRTEHRVVCAIEDAGFEIRDRVLWLYGSGFPKSHNQHGEWEGWGTALKPAVEIGVLARKPLIGTVAANLAEHGTGALNIDGCRVGIGEGGSRTGETTANKRYADSGSTNFAATPGLRGGSENGRWPANLCHDGSDEVLAAFPGAPGQQREVNETFAPKQGTAVDGDYGPRPTVEPRGDSGSAARFFYAAKAGPDDRHGSKHPTVKPVSLMRWLVRLITPPGGLVLDPFAGTGTTGIAAIREGMRAVLIEREADYHADILRRLAALDGSDTPLFSGAQMDIEEIA